MRRLKGAVLKAYEMVPEAYRQKFSRLRKCFTQTHVELVRELELCFTRWCIALAVESFEDLVNLLVLEQFKNMLPSLTAIYIAEHKVSNAAEAAVLADEYELIHKSCFDVGRLENEHTGKNVVPSIQSVNMSITPCKYEICR